MKRIFIMLIVAMFSFSLEAQNLSTEEVSNVFADPFANTEESTIVKKLSGPDKMLEIIDTYWEAQGINVKNSRNT
jgi:hypothetical protein